MIQHLRAMLLAAIVTLVGCMLADWLLEAARLGIVWWRPAAQGAIIGAWLGLMLTIMEYGMIDLVLAKTLLAWWQQGVQGLILGAILGAGALFAADALAAFFLQAPIVRIAVWGLFGAVFGLIEGIKWVSVRRAQWAALGAACGGVLGGVAISFAPHLLLDPSNAWVVLFTTCMANACFGALLGLGLSLSRSLTRAASLTIVSAPMPKQINQSFPIGSIADTETIGLGKVHWSLTGDGAIRGPYAMLSKNGAEYVIQPFEGARVAVSDEAIVPEDLHRCADLRYTPLHNPEEWQTLRHGNVIRLGDGTYLYFEYQQLDVAQLRPASVTAALLPLCLLTALFQAPAAEALTVNMTDARGLPDGRIRVDVQVFEDELPVEGLAARDFQVDDHPYGEDLMVQTGEAAAEPNFIVLVLDKSGSMVEKTLDGKQTKMDAAKQAAKRFLTQLGPRDLVAVLSFDDTVESHEFSVDRKEIEQLIDGVEMAPFYAGRTNLYDAIGYGLGLLSRVRDQQPPAVRCSLVLLTDGAQSVEEGKTRFTPAELIPTARRLNATIYTIGFGDPSAKRDSKAYVDQDYMSHVAHDTRGTYHFARNADELAGAYDRILRAIKGHYRLVWQNPRTVRDPYAHPIRISVQPDKNTAAASAEGHYSFSGTVPQLAGTLGQQIVTVAGFVLLLGSLSWILPPGLAHAERLLRPTAPRRSLVEEAEAIWHARNRRTKRRVVRKVKSDDAQAAVRSPELAPASPTQAKPMADVEPPAVPTKKSKVRFLDRTEGDA